MISYNTRVEKFKLDVNPSGNLVRSFTTPNNLIPRESNNTINYVDGRPTITQGRQDNRGFEGLTGSVNYVNKYH